MTYYLKDDDPIPGSDLAGYVADKCDEVERLRAENERLLDHIRQMMNVPEFARNSMKDQCIAELEAEREALRAENKRLTLDTTWQDHADHWQKRAMEAEARVAELSEALRDLYEMTERYAFATRARIRARKALAGKGE